MKNLNSKDPPLPPISQETKPVISGLPLESLQQLCAPLPAYRAKQVFQWISRGVASFQGMTDLGLPLRNALDARFSLYSSRISEGLEDPDGTVKLQITLGDGRGIEAVLLEDRENRKTACLSTQAGCPMGCVFCKTGTLGFSRNLDSGEIVEQFLHLRSLGGDISNIVIMGMGEPLLNLPELRKALEVLTAPEGLGLSKRRITLSTCGIIGGIRDLTDRGPDIRLAVSLTTADQELREQLMPAAKDNPLSGLKEALCYYQRQRNRRITLEAVLLGGINTRQKDLDALAVFTQGLEAVINLIPWNPAAGLTLGGRVLRPPSRGEFEGFVRGLETRGLKVTRRLRKGQGIAGACGQLGLS